MKVNFKEISSKNWRVYELDEVLTPEPYLYDMGAVEEAREIAREACKTMGRLLAHLVDKGSLSLEDACSIADQIHSVEKVDE